MVLLSVFLLSISSSQKSSRFGNPGTDGSRTQDKASFFSNRSLPCRVRRAQLQLLHHRAQLAADDVSVPRITFLECFVYHLLETDRNGSWTHRQVLAEKRLDAALE